MPDHVLRVRRTDSEGDYLLINVTSTSSKPLDLKLVASEGEHVYPGQIRESNVKSLQASNYSGDLETWKTVLGDALLQQRPAGPLPESLHGVETVAALTGKTLAITIRKNISGITQRLGAINLTQNDDEEISLFDWANTAASNAESLRFQLETLQTSVTAQQDSVAKLNQQLDDLVQAKKDHEAELLKKFTALLNEKKLKIRDQQRLLAGAKVDPKAAEEVSRSRNGNGSNHARAAGASSRGKRKANGAPEATMHDYGGDEDDDEELPVKKEETPQDSDRETTDAETADEEDEDGFAVAPSTSERASRLGERQTTVGGGGRGKVLEKAKEKAKVDGNDAMEVDADVLPPKRELPKRLARKREAEVPKVASAPVQARGCEEEEDETDEEL